MSLLNFLGANKAAFSLIFFAEMIDKCDNCVYFSLYNFPFGIGFESYLILAMVPGHHIEKVLNDLNLIFLIGED